MYYAYRGTTSVKLWRYQIENNKWRSNKAGFPNEHEVLPLTPWWVTTTKLRLLPGWPILGGLSQVLRPAKRPNSVRAHPSSDSSADSSLPAEVVEYVLEPDDIPKSLNRENYFDLNSQPLLNCFTTAEITIEFSTTAEEFINQISNHLHEEDSNPGK